MTSWMQTHTGVRFDLLNPTTAMVRTIDIAHSLFGQNRFNGHMEYNWTVGHHSLAVAEWVRCCRENQDPRAVLQALLHDAAEAYIGDIISPVKELLGDRVHEIERRILNTIFVAYSVPLDWYDDVLMADKVLCSTEAEHLFLTKPIDKWNERLAPPLDLNFLMQFSTSTFHDYIEAIHLWHELSAQQRSAKGSSTDKNSLISTAASIAASLSKSEKN